MLKNVRKSSFISDLYISKQNLERLLMWGLSEKEINFICFGKGNHIEDVVRLANVASSPKRFASWHENVSKSIVRTKHSEGKKVIAWGHSHPYKGNDQYPSKMDVEVINTGRIELIVFPPKNEVRAWRIRENLRQTLLSEIRLQIENTN